MNPVQAAERAIREGSVDEALQLLQSAVRASPGDAALRIFLFQLLAVQGQWERSLNQLNVAAELDASRAREKALEAAGAEAAAALGRAIAEIRAALSRDEPAGAPDEAPVATNDLDSAEQAELRGI